LRNLKYVPNVSQSLSVLRNKISKKEISKYKKDNPSCEVIS